MTDWASAIAAQLWCKPAHSAKEMDVAFAMDIAAAIRKARNDALEGQQAEIVGLRNERDQLKGIVDAQREELASLRKARTGALEAAEIRRPVGCICPPTSEQTCQSALCPRKGYGIKLAGAMP